MKLKFLSSMTEEEETAVVDLCTVHANYKSNKYPVKMTDFGYGE